MQHYLDFEKPISDLEQKIDELKKQDAADDSQNNQKEIEQLEKKAKQKITDIYRKLTPWQKTQVARHPERPHFLSYAKNLFTDLTNLDGDRLFADDQAIQAGLARFNGRPIAYIGQEKGVDTKSRIKHNFGSPLPEGYRKAQRIMSLADRFNLPLITLVDTAGAYPGVSAEDRGQAEAIAQSIYKMLELKVPVITVIIGEGGSGGALAIAAANKVYMLEHSIYSVISPEGAASILWRDAARAVDAATNMNITAQDLHRLEIIDGVIPEPIGGAQRDPYAAIVATAQVIEHALEKFDGLSGEEIRKQRHDKYMSIGKHLL